MGYIKGRDVILMIDKGAGYVPHVCAVTFGLKTTVDTKEIMTEGDGEWSKPKQQSVSYQLTFDGVTEYPLNPLTGYDTFDFLENQCQFVNFQYKIYYTTNGSTVIKMITGEALVIDSDLSSGPDNVMDSSFTCAGFGAYQRFNSSVACNATIATVAFDSQFGQSIIMNYTGLTGSTTLRYRVDSGIVRTEANMPVNGLIFITHGTGAPGLHTFTVWAVCESGEEGVSISTTYNKT